MSFRSSPGSHPRRRRSSSAPRSCRCRHARRPPPPWPGATIDALSGGRFIFGFGPSGPQVSEGWYGVPYAKPWGRTREYIEVVREIIARTGPLKHDGEHYQLPMPSGTGQGKALKLNFHPIRNEIPVFVGAIGRKSVEMAAEMCDGWIPIFFSPAAFEETWGEHLEAGFAKGGRSRSDLEISPSIQVAIDGDTEAARNVVKAGLLLYLGGMGSRKTNFYVDLACRFGFEDAALEVQSLFLDGKRDEAFKAIPDELVNATSLVGTEAEVTERVERFSEVGIDRLICSAGPPRPGRAPAHDRAPRGDRRRHSAFLISASRRARQATAGRSLGATRGRSGSLRRR